MKFIKTASGKKTIKISKKEWQAIGKTAGWTKEAQTLGDILDHKSNRDEALGNYFSSERMLYSAFKNMDTEKHIKILRLWTYYADVIMDEKLLSDGWIKLKNEYLYSLYNLALKEGEDRVAEAAKNGIMKCKALVDSEKKKRENLEDTI